MELQVYFNTQYVLLTDDKSNKNLANFYNCRDKSEIIDALTLIENKVHDNVILYHENFSELFSLFSSCFRYIEAAGGLVCNEKDEFLFIKRLGVWDLPKGKLEKHETPELAAVREVSEETGLMKLTLQTYICSTWHTYPHKKGDVLKQTFWYAMQAHSSEQLIPQIEEDILEIEWKHRNEFESIIANTYPSIIDVLRNNTNL